MIETEVEKEMMNLKEGYLFINGKSVWKPWSMKAKYFILTNECLYCYKRRGDLDAIPTDVIPLDGVSVSVDEEKKGLRRRYYIKINSPRKSLNLFCFMADERNAWLTAILSALAGKYTEKGYIRNLRRKSGKTLSLGECEFSRRHQIVSLEHTRHMSISCLELTDLSVVVDPLSPTRSVVPIRKTIDLSDSAVKKISSSSLDDAIRSDATTQLIGECNSAPLKRHKMGKSSDKQKSFTMSHKRHKSMSDLLSITTEHSMTLEPALQKKKRKSKGLSLMLGNNLNFKSISIGNLNRLK